MKIHAVNGSPRKAKNTATLLNKALDGAAAAAGAGAETELINLYDYSFTGCRSCFACKRLGGKSYGRCAVNDELRPVLEKLAEADVIIFGSPIYLANITGQMKCFLERLIFQYFVYNQGYSSLAPKKCRTGFIYDMNVKEADCAALNYRAALEKNEFFIMKVFSPPATLYVYDTYQFDDYSKYKVECFSEPDKAKTRAEQFPRDCARAYELGAQLAKSVRP